MAKPYLLIFEGVDRTGKDSLMLEIARMTDYTHMNIVRGPVGFMAYNTLYQKKVDEVEYQVLERRLMDIPHLMVYLYADTDTLEERARATHEAPLPRRMTFNEHLQVYTYYYELSPLHKLSFDTSKMTTYQIASYIVGYLSALSH